MGLPRELFSTIFLVQSDIAWPHQPILRKGHCLGGLAPRGLANSMGDMSHSGTQDAGLSGWAQTLPFLIEATAPPSA